MDRGRIGIKSGLYQSDQGRIGTKDGLYKSGPQSKNRTPPSLALDAQCQFSWALLS